MDNVASIISGVTMKTREEVEAAVNTAVEAASPVRYAVEDFKESVLGEQHDGIETKISEQDIPEAAEIKPAAPNIERQAEEQIEIDNGPELG